MHRQYPEFFEEVDLDPAELSVFGGESAAGSAVEDELFAEG